MANKCSIKPIIIPILPVGQIANYQSGIVTYLDKGSYSIMYNHALKEIAGGITGTQAIITAYQQYGTIGFIELLASAKTGPMGNPATATFNGSFQNNIYIATDNTPIYVSLFMQLLNFTTWQHTTDARYSSFSNRLIFIPI